MQSGSAVIPTTSASSASSAPSTNATRAASKILLPTALAAALFTALTALTALPAAAHHGWSANDGEIEVSGTVVAGINLSGPHGTMQLRDDDGELWDITLAPAPRTHRAGLRDGMLPVGDPVTVHGERNADTERREIKVRRVQWDGQTFDVYPAPR